ncbi:MAG: nitrogen fixation protein NifX [Hyphomicrobiaceae bacterium]|nr:nitrogen fixation protein NifX [Hyphomicrobiaceae bacterium]MCC0006558.1 nitrogen fixation protein NifX [Hyphomicrobiaceae bacterium]
MNVRRLQLVDDNAVSAAGPEPAIRIAIATQDMKGLNAHFGSARKFAIYDVTPGASRFVSVAAFDEVSEEDGKHKEDGDDRITPKVDALAGVHLLFVRAIGGPAAAKVVRAGIHPVKIAEPQPIEGVIARVQAMLSGSPPPWLRKILGQAGFVSKPSFVGD